MIAKLAYLWIAPKKGKYPCYPRFCPIAHIVSKPMLSTGDDVLSDLTPELMTPTEVDYHVDRMIADLNKIRRALHKKFEVHEKSRIRDGSK
jgi:hypothetical protein